MLAIILNFCILGNGFITELFSQLFELLSRTLLSQASHKGSAGDSEQLSKLSLAAGLGQREATGGPSAGGSSGSEEDPTVHAAVQDQVSILVRMYMYVCV